MIDFETGVMLPADGKIERRLSQMKGVFADEKAYLACLEKEDSLVYEVYTSTPPEREGDLIYCTSVIYPGKVGDEFYMTKGHYHAKRGTSEVYLCVGGRGMLVLENPHGDSTVLDMYPGSMSYIPPFWAHRTVNTGSGPFIFIGVYPADAGHDYGTIEACGMMKLVLQRGGQTVVLDSQRASPKAGEGLS
ncbi:MAG: glucose-6-phosphate isomerase [Firmicutes bacterium]|nr:glucose-6-phosphate isomerase [Bacillota bacterium]